MPSGRRVSGFTPTIVVHVVRWFQGGSRPGVACDTRPPISAPGISVLTDNEGVKIKLTRQSVASWVAGVGFSRHAAVPVLRATAPAFRRAAHSSFASFTKRLASMVAGAGLIGVAVALLVQADLGLPPYDVMSSALSMRLGISLGQSGWLMAGSLFCVAAVLRHRPSPWGIAYILTIGVAIDSASGLLTRPETLAGRWVFVLAAVVLLASGVNLVVYSGTTGGPFELLMLAGEDHGINRIAVRYGLDIGVFGLGVILGGSFGPATVVFALAFGLALKIIGQVLVDHGEGRRLRLEALGQERFTEHAGVGSSNVVVQAERRATTTST